MQPLIEIVDRTNRALGRAAAWLCCVMVLLGAWNALALFVGPRTGLRLTSNSLTELQWYLFSLVFLVAAPAALREGAHVRVDVLHARLLPRQRDWIELGGLLSVPVPVHRVRRGDDVPGRVAVVPRARGLARPGRSRAVAVEALRARRVRVADAPRLAEAARRALALASPAPEPPRSSGAEAEERRP